MPTIGLHCYHVTRCCQSAINKLSTKGSDMKKQTGFDILKVAVLASGVLTGCGGGGGGSAAPAPASADIDRTKTQWFVTTTTSAVDSVKTTTISAPSADGATFAVYCNSKGQKGYYIKTDFVTGSGSVAYRIGANPSKSEIWDESADAGYKLLTPRAYDVQVLKALYQNWDFVTRLDKFSTGSVEIGYPIRGFGAAIDKTRAECGWSTDDFPPDNGWGKPYVDVAPATAKEATYAPGSTQQFGLKAWLDKNVSGKTQLMIRVGENKALCAGTFVISGDRFYVEQSGSRVSAVPGTYFQLSCPSELPATFSLQGAFNPDAPFVLKAYPFHYHTTDPGTPISSVVFE